MKRKLATSIFCFLFINCFGQFGEWTWMSGDNFFQSAGHYGIQGIPDTANYPPAVYEPCDWHDQQGNFWVFGGFCSYYNSDMADLWKYNPATNEWTWMTGIGVIPNGADTGNYGTMGVSSPLNRPCGRGWGTPSWSDKNGNLWMYGGSNNSADLWKYEIATNEWTWVQGTPHHYFWTPTYPHHGTFQVPDTLNTPGNRVELAATWTDNDGNLWLFGGASEDSIFSMAIYNDMWKYDVSINQWVWMNGPNYPNDPGYYGVQGVASPLNCPPSRMAYAKWKDAAGNFYLFGGLTFGGCGYTGYNDVWKYDITLNNWIWIGGDSQINSAGSYAGECVSLNSNIPRNAFENRSTCADSLGNVFMFGSMGAACGTYSANKNEFWHYSSIHNEWTLIMQDRPVVWGTKGVSSASNAPPKTFGSVAWYRNSEIWIFAGSDYGNPNSYNSVWKYSFDPILNCFLTGIEENNSSDELNLFPNPFSNELTVRTDDNETAEIILYDISSRILFQEKFISTTTIDTRQLSKGIYFYQVRDKDGVIQNGKILKE